MEQTDPLRRLDAEVAEKIFGWYVERFVWGGFEGEVWITDPSRKDEPPRQRQYVTINPKPFSTDLAAAWTIVEHLRAQDCRVRLSDWRDDGKWWVTIIDAQGIYHENEPCASLPEAICWAALATLA